MSVTIVSLSFKSVFVLIVLEIIRTKILVVGQCCFIVNCIVFQRFLHRCEKLECDMILLYDYFEDYLVKLVAAFF